MIKHKWFSEYANNYQLISKKPICKSVLIAKYVSHCWLQNTELAICMKFNFQTFIVNSAIMNSHENSFQPIAALNNLFIDVN